MYILLLIIHVIVCLILVAVVLLQAGRGGGFSDMMGGAQPQSIFGTQTNAFMTRATEVCAVLFIVTSLSLGILSVQRGKSLMERGSLAHAVKKVDAKAIDKKDMSIDDLAKVAKEAAEKASAIAKPVSEAAKTDVVNQVPSAVSEKPADAKKV